MSWLNRALDSDVFHSFKRSPVTVASAIVALICIGGALLAPWIAPRNVMDLASLDLIDAFKPPLTEPGWLLGSDDQGRDVLSAILFGGRISLLVGFSAVIFAAVVGLVVGLCAGYLGGTVEMVLMRIVDIQLTFPSILIAMLVDGIARVALPQQVHEKIALLVVIFAIGIATWPQFARTVRGSTLVERNKEYVLAARVIGLSGVRIMATHVLPNVLGPVLVIATLNLGLAILTEATLSFLGVGVPVTQPSLGTLIRIGNDFLMSGEWWIAIFPGLALVAMVLSVNLLGDWLRDALNPRLR
jgi:peptide/nickel transport system permease protein